MMVADAIKNPTATPIILAEITAGLWCRAWVVDGTFANTFKIATTLEVTAVRWNRDTLLTLGSSVANVDANPGRWIWDGTFLWVNPLSGEIWDATIQALVIFRFANQMKVLNNLVWSHRIDTAPNLSKRIEAVFGDVGQIGGGNLKLLNADKYFDELQDLQWNAGTVTLHLGCDLPNGKMVWADYETLATWAVEDWSRDEVSFSLRLIEPKAKIKTKLPFDTFNLADFPNISSDLIGKPIPIAYGQLLGVSPILINGNTKTFKVAGHAIFRFDRVRISKSLEETRTITTTASDWILHSGDTYRYFLPGWDVKNVTSDGDSLTEKTSIDDVIATNGSWYAEGDNVYINPQTGETIDSETYIINCSKTTDSFEISNFASTDEANGEFTLGDDWTSGTEVAVDFKGKTNADGTWMQNAFDIIRDLLSLVGETNLNSASFTEAVSRLNIGFDQFGNPFTVRKPSVHLDTLTEVLEVIGDILAVVGGFLYSDETGQYYAGVTEPLQMEGLPIITDLELLDFSESHETKDIVTKTIVKYAHYEQQHTDSVHEETRTDYQALADQKEAVIRESAVGFYEEADVVYYSQRALILEGRPIRKFQIATAWSQLQRNPGDQIRLQSTLRNVDMVLEVLEVRPDLGTKRITITLGNLRGFEDSSGHWVEDADVLPTRFSQLAGYGAGSLTWNAAWDDEIKHWVRNNVGYWVNDNSFAEPVDADSHGSSVWW